MTVLSENKQRPVLMPSGGLNTREYGMAGYTNFGGGSTAHTIYKGSLVCIDVTDTDGYCRACPDITSTAITSSDIFLGVAQHKQEVTSSDTGDGSKEVTVYTNGVWGFAVGSLDVTDIGAPAYASDDDTITTTSSNALWVGTIVDADSTYVWVDISHAAGRTSSAT